ncbi:hypothetical protein [Erwinia mallotivora]|uniref:hypothetical protein n=1 Tax=Erwinia mallotivora TaxID=69222 RepID=UPI0021BED924|nr:hypothetical protein [Erwinia mallotivora]
MDDLLQIIADFFNIWPWVGKESQNVSLSKNDRKKIANLQFRPICNIMKDEKNPDAASSKLRHSEKP